MTNSIQHQTALHHKKKYDFSKTDHSGDREILQAASKNKAAKIPGLLKKGANVNAKDITEGETPLFIAVDNNFVDTAKMLIQEGAIVNCKTYSKVTPLHSAVLNENEELVALLLSKGAKYCFSDKWDNTPISLAFKMRNEQILSIFYGVIDIKEVNARGNTLFLEAATAGNHKAVLYLLQRGSDINFQNSSGNTALHIAALNNCTSVITALLGFKANMNLVNKSGFTPAQCAFQSGYFDLSKTLTSVEDKEKKRASLNMPSATPSSKSSAANQNRKSAPPTSPQVSRPKPFRADAPISNSTPLNTVHHPDPITIVHHNSFTSSDPTHKAVAKPPPPPPANILQFNGSSRMDRSADAPGPSRGLANKPVGLPRELGQAYFSGPQNLRPRARSDAPPVSQPAPAPTNAPGKAYVPPQTVPQLPQRPRAESNPAPNKRPLPQYKPISNVRPNAPPAFASPY